MANILDLIVKMIEWKASDLHLTVGAAPMLRVDGELRPFDNHPLTPDETQSLAYSVMKEEQKKKFEDFDLDKERGRQVDFSFGIRHQTADGHPFDARFRANVFMQRGMVSLVLRHIPTEIKDFDALGAPKILAEFCDRPRGLVLVTGPTGSGKSTTLAAMVDKINRERAEHILTIEDPIEFVHKHKKCIVNQREVYSDTTSFAQALKVALRQDPDVVLLGEIRDKITAEIALQIAETGHLTFATLHTNSAAQTINRLIDMFEQGERDAVRGQLGFVLEGVCCQQLIPKIGGGRHPFPDSRRQGPPDPGHHGSEPEVRHADSEHGPRQARHQPQDLQGRSLHLFHRARAARKVHLRQFPHVRGVIGKTGARLRKTLSRRI